MALATVVGNSKKRRLTVAAANALRAHASVMSLRFERAERWLLCDVRVIQSEWTERGTVSM